MPPSVSLLREARGPGASGSCLPSSLGHHRLASGPSSLGQPFPPQFPCPWQFPPPPNLPNRLFYNVFQAFPRSMADEVAWDDLVVSNDEFAELRRLVDQEEHSYRINWLDHETLDRLYVMVFPDGSLTVPSGGSYLSYGPFLAVDDLEALLEQTRFDAVKHRRHSRGWSRRTGD